jgi:hypothetical protein
LKLDSIFQTLEQLKSFKRFDWTISAPGPVHLHEILVGIAEAGERMLSMESCDIRLRHVACPLFSTDAVNRNQLLDKILVTNSLLANSS